MLFPADFVNVLVDDLVLAFCVGAPLREHNGKEPMIERKSLVGGAPGNAPSIAWLN